MRKLALVTRFKSTLARPVLNVKDIIARQHEYRDSIVRRKLPESTVSDLHSIVERRRQEIELEHKIGAMRHERKLLGEQMKSNAGDTVKQALVEIKKSLGVLELEHAQCAADILSKAESLPNLIDSQVGDRQTIVECINCSSELDAMASLPPTKHDHLDVAEKLQLVDFKTAARVSGASWYYLVGDGALLEQALVQYSLKKARQHGYRMVIPPSIVKNDVIGACGFRPNDQNGERQIYTLEHGDLGLTGTAEIPLGALHSATDFDRKQQLPLKYVGVSRAYRAEAGARGRDTKGLYRVHEFTKVELFHFTQPDSSGSELEQLRKFQTEIIAELGLKARMVRMPADDLGAPALMKYDCEAWMPGRRDWGELTSSSNCGDYQARRLGIRYRGHDNKLSYVHTLNGTCMAVPRVIVAIIEQNYDEATKSIVVPKVLREYMDGKERISAD